jgi:RNA polymerase sigma factor (sigma-70 family)
MARRDTDTTMGGSQTRFPDTRHSAVRNLGGLDSGLRECALEALIAAYWKPVYKYIRVRWNQSNENAKDLTQSFFARALEKEFFEGYDPAKARFRTYLRACLDAFLSNQNKAAARMKRGGDATIVSLDFETAEGELRQRDIIAAGQSPEEYFQREWARNLLGLAAGDLKRECEERGKRIQYRIFERYDLDDSAARPTYDGLAAEFTVTSATVTNHLAAMRRRFRHLLLACIRATAVTEQEFRDEARTVLGIEA